MFTGCLVALSAPGSHSVHSEFAVQSDAAAVEPIHSIRQETTLLASPLLWFGPTHVAFLQGVRVDFEPQGREVATSWIRLELRLAL
jgi:hypothetical protein